MSSFTLDVVRADDLLVLSLEFVNLALDPDETQVPRRLVRADPAEEALLIVHFPPQHVSEMCFTPAEDGHVDGLAEAAAGRVDALISGESRLAFRVPRGAEPLPLTLDALLDWDRFEPALALDETVPGFEGPAISIPSPNQTAIEMPYRLVLSPNVRERWSHHRQAAVRDGRCALWHTTLTPPPRLGQPPLSLVRAIWSPDHPQGTPGLNPFPMTLSAQDRGEITRLSSDFRIPGYFPVPLQVDRLMLSALGGWLRAHSAFDFPGELFDLREWVHVANMGRDQLVRTVRQGFLYPFRHVAHIVTMTERKLSAPSPDAGRVSYLEQRRWLVVHEPECGYEDRKDMPFVSVRIDTLVTPIDGLDEHEIFLPSLGPGPVEFQVTGTDHEGRRVKFATPLVFVPETKVAHLDRARELFAGRRVAFSNENVAFAPIAGSVRGGEPGPTTLRTVEMTFDHQEDAAETPPFHPRLTQAIVHLPAVEQMLGGDQKSVGTRIRYHAGYAARGFGGVAGGVFAELQGGLPLAFPADKAGGLAVPALNVTGLSRDHGAVPNVADLASGPFSNPIDGLDGELLGVIKLKDVIEAATDAAQLPKLKSESAPDGHRTRFEWKPRLKQSADKDLLITSGDSSLELHGQLFRPRSAGEPVSDVKGTFSNFALSFADVLRLDFGSLTFHMVTGQKPEFGADIKGFTFMGALKWLEVVAAELARVGGGFGGTSGPALAITPAGISATVGVALRTFAIGVLSVQNVALSATLSLSFFGEPAQLVLALCSADKPFLVSYSVFGGGGFFSLTVGTGKTPKKPALFVNALLEFGAVAAIDLVLAKGVAQVMVGLTFGMKGEGVTLGGLVRIHGCLEILQLASLTVDFTLQLTYESETNEAVVQASLVVQARVLAFTKSVTLTVERRFSDVSDLLHLTDAAGSSHWEEYSRAFA